MKDETIQGVLVIVFKIRDGKTEYLLLRHKDGFWTFPGGKVEENDTSLISGAKRELFEETLLDVSEERISNTGFKNEFIYGLEKPERSGKKGIIHLLILSLSEDEKPNLASEITEIKWVSEKEALRLLPFEDIKNLFRKFLIS